MIPALAKAAREELNSRQRGAAGAHLLYLSLYFKRYRRHYYDLLQKVRLEGDWEEWLRFFMAGVHETSHLAVQTAKNLVALFDEHADKIQSLGKPAGSALRVHSALQKNPILSIARAAEITGLSFPTVTRAMEHLIGLGIAKEITGKPANRLYSYDSYIQILSQGTEPIG